MKKSFYPFYIEEFWLFLLKLVLFIFNIIFFLTVIVRCDLIYNFAVYFP